MTKWEYKVLKRQFAPLKDYYETELDELGKSGWELVQDEQNPTYYRIYKDN